VSEVLHHLAASPGVDCWALLLPYWVGSSYISHAKLDKLRSFRMTHELLYVRSLPLLPPAKAKPWPCDTQDQVVLDLCSGKSFLVGLMRVKHAVAPPGPHIWFTCEAHASMPTGTQPVNAAQFADEWHGQWAWMCGIQPLV
jgi:hypothetical protein